MKFQKSGAAGQKNGSLIKKETSLEPILNSVIVIYVISLVGAASSREKVAL